MTVPPATADFAQHPTDTHPPSGNGKRGSRDPRVGHGEPGSLQEPAGQAVDRRER